MIANRFINLACKRQLQRPAIVGADRLFSFNFAGPKNLNDILKKELIEDKSATEVADIWYTYHENKVSIDIGYHIAPKVSCKMATHPRRKMYMGSF